VGGSEVHKREGGGRGRLREGGKEPTRVYNSLRGRWGDRGIG
jgi:hypothetical protein